MNYWIFMFRPEMFATVKEQKVLGVHPQNERRFMEVNEGDKFVAYMSKKSLLVGLGEVTSKPFFQEDNLFTPDSGYPFRCTVEVNDHFEPKDARELLWGLSEFDSKQMTTTPANYLFCRGGFMQIATRDYQWLEEVLSGSFPLELPIK